MASSSATRRAQSWCVRRSLAPLGVRRSLVALLVVASLPAAGALAQRAPVAVVLNAEDGKSLGLAILQPADGVSLLLPASAAVVRVAPGAVEVTSHAVRWSSAQVATVDRLTVVVRVTGEASTPERVVVSNGTDVRTIELSVAGMHSIAASRAVRPTPAPSPVHPAAVTSGAQTGASWLSAAATRFGGAPVPSATGPVLDAAPVATPQHHAPSAPMRPVVPPPETPDPRPTEKMPVFNLASHHSPSLVPVHRAVAAAPPPPVREVTPQPTPTNTASTSWRFAGSLNESPVRSSATETAPAPTPVRAQPAPIRSAPTPAYTVADLFTSTGFPTPTRVASAPSDDEVPADAVAVTDHWRAHGVLRVAATQSVDAPATRGGEVSLEQPVNESVAITATGGAARAEQYATAGVRVAPHAAASAVLSPFLAIALGATAVDHATSTRFVFAGGVQIPVGSRAMVEVGGERVLSPGTTGTALVHIGVRALLGMGS